jgi:hypothetical protein
LEEDAKKARNISAGHVREPRRLYEAERLHVLKHLGLNAMLGGRADVGKNKHLGRFPRGRQGGRAGMAQADGGQRAREKFNAGRNKDFAAELVALTSTIGHHLAHGGGVPDGVWSRFDNLNTNRRFLCKADDEVGSQTRNTVGPGSYLKNDFALPRGGRMGQAQAAAPRRTEAQLAAEDRMKHRESSFRTSKDYGAKEATHLQRLFEELGRPRFSYTRGDANYEEHLDKFAFRHVQIYPGRLFGDIKDRVHNCLKLNKFSEVGEGGYWAARRKQPPALATAPARLSGARSPLPFDATKARAPSWELGRRGADRTPPPGPAEGGSEPYEYRSIGRQVESGKPGCGSAAFARAGAAGSMLTMAEQLATLTPTATTYRPKDTYISTKERPRSFPWKQDHGDGASVKLGDAVVGPGAYDAASMTGPQHDSTKTSRPALTVPKAWTQRLPRDLEPLQEKYGAAAPLPPIPKLKALAP